MVGLGYQDIDWVGGNVKDILDAIFLQDGCILEYFCRVWGPKVDPKGQRWLN